MTRSTRRHSRWGSRRRPLAALASVAVTVCGTAGTAPAAPWHNNCTTFNHRYPHGVGKVGAHDKTKSRKNPVTTFKRSSSLYAAAWRANPDLDRDEDKIACEKH